MRSSQIQASGLETAFDRAGDSELDAILRDRAAGNLDAFVLQDGGDPVVGERVVRVFGGDEVANLLLDGRVGYGFAGLGGKAAREELAQT